MSEGVVSGPLIFTTAWGLVLLFAEVRGWVNLRRVAKPLASCGFLWAGQAAGLLDGSTVGLAVTVALLLSFVGDVLLLATSKRGLLLGLVAFALAHVAFIVAFLIRGVAPGWLAATGLILGVVGVLVWRWLSPHVGSMRGPVLGYVVIVSAMFAGGVASHGHAANWALLFGTGCFYLSDLFVARHRFVAPGFTNKIVGQPLYYLGQLLIASFVLS
jgi:uncharacterized membrane protein YhhN